MSLIIKPRLCLLLKKPSNPIPNIKIKGKRLFIILLEIVILLFNNKPLNNKNCNAKFTL